MSESGSGYCIYPVPQGLRICRDGRHVADVPLPPLARHLFLGKALREWSPAIADALRAAADANEQSAKE